MQGFDAVFQVMRYAIQYYIYVYIFSLTYKNVKYKRNNKEMGKEKVKVNYLSEYYLLAGISILKQ